MNRIKVELSESPAAPADDTSAGSGEHTLSGVQPSSPTTTEGMLAPARGPAETNPWPGTASPATATRTEKIAKLFSCRRDRRKIA